MKLLKNNSGFTLLEFVTALVIIAILAGLATVSFNVYRQKNRDIKRITDIKDIQGSLEIYYRNNELYPTNLAFGDTWDGYIDSLPNNPLPRADNGCPNIEYEYTPDYDNSSYHLTFCLGSAVADITSGIKVALPGGDIINGTTGDYNTKLLLHMDGDDDGTTFIDSSPSAKGVVVTSAVTKTGIKKFGTASGYFDRANSNYLSLISNNDWRMDLADQYTVDFWVRFNSLTGYQFLVSNRSGATADTLMWQISKRETSNVIWFQYFTSTTTNTVATVDVVGTDTWYHVAFTKNGDVYKIYIDGVEKASETLTEAWNSNNLPVHVGTMDTTAHFLDGYIDELRISKGIARWTEAFVPPTEEY